MKPQTKAYRDILSNLANLLKVKTIITLAVVITYCFMTLEGIPISSNFDMLIGVVLTYYFTKDAQDGRDRNGSDN